MYHSLANPSSRSRRFVKKNDLRVSRLLGLLREKHQKANRHSPGRECLAAFSLGPHF
jgi:hypothetical protein